MNKRLWCYCFILCISSILNGQTGKQWYLGRTLHLNFLDSANFQIRSNPLNTAGSVRFFNRPNGSSCMIYTTNATNTGPVLVRDSNYLPVFPQPFFPGIDMNNYLCMFPLGFDTFTAFHNFGYFKQYNCADWQKNQFGDNPYINSCDFEGKYGLYTKLFAYKQNKPVMIEDLRRILAVPIGSQAPIIRRSKNFEYIGIQNIKLSNQEIWFYTNLLGQNWARPVDSVKWNPYFLIPPQFSDTSVFVSKIGVSGPDQNDISPGGKIFAFKVTVLCYFKTKPDLKMYQAEYLGIINLDKLQFLGIPKLVLIDKGETSKIPGDIIGPAPEGVLINSLAFSPNGKKLYATLAKQKYNNSNNAMAVFSFDENGGQWNKKDSIFSMNKISPFFVNPYGGITFYTYDRANSKYFIYNFHDANNPVQLSKTEVKSNQVNFTSTTHHPYDYLRFDHSINFKDCGAYLKFTNRCDESFGIDTYEWWISKNKEQTDVAYFKGKVPPPVFYSKDGVYFVKVHGTNSKDPNGYAEWWWDSIKIAMPAKPKAAFSSNPQLYCLGKQVSFNNTSNQGQLNPNKKVSYFWNFGDGDTSSNSFPKHIYKLPGQYDVQLIIDNGYCTDTLQQKEYINIVDAPQSGFSISENEGCTPFEIKVTERNTRPVISRKYDMGNDFDLFPDTSIFGFIYKKKGRYQIFQHLYSATGCESLDSALVIVHRGFNEYDSSHIYNGSFTSNQTIELNWLPMPDAKSYKVFGGINTNYQYLTTLPANILSYTVSIPSPSKYSFKVIAYDSCDNPSQEGRNSLPIFLTHSQDWNKSVTLNYTRYQNWNVPIVKYEILFASKSLPSKDNGLSYTYIDHEYAKTAFEMSDTTQCYQIKATAIDGRVTLSNTICAKQKPEVYLPSAFTPDANGLNDVYKPVVLGMRNYELSIYNRWGQLVSKEMNGIWKPNNAATGVYVAVFNGVDLNGKSIAMTQTIHLIR
jgi:PKD repeat protein